MKTIEIETASGILTHDIRGKDSITDSILRLDRVRSQVERGGNWYNPEEMMYKMTDDYNVAINALRKLRNAESIMVAQAGRITELELKLDQFCAKPEPKPEPKLAAEDILTEQTARWSALPNLYAETDKEVVKCGLEAGDCTDVHSNQADREANVLAVLFDAPSALWHALIELCMPNGSTSLGILISDEDGTFPKRDTDRFGRHRFIDKNVSYAKLPKKWLRAIGEQSTESAEVTDSYPHSEVLCGHSQNGSIYIYRDGELDEVDPEEYFGGKLDAYPQPDTWTTPTRYRGAWRGDHRPLFRERAENFFNI